MAIDETSAPSAGRSLADAYERHRDWLVRRLAIVAGDADEARDLAQETFARAARAWPLPGSGGDGGGVDDEARWLATVGIRLAIDARRQRRRWGLLPIRETDAVWAMSADADLWVALAALDRRTRAALVMTVIDGYTQAEAAAALNVPRGTVASWLSRARVQLRAFLEVEP